jgi:prepilin-type N-terminal cleavage/methylation domain-containing protein
MRRNKAFTLIELLVVISIIALLVGILLPALGSARMSARKMTSNTQLRGTHQAFVIFAGGNEGIFPGLTDGGRRWVMGQDMEFFSAFQGYGSHVEARYAILFEGNYITPEYAIHPNEPDQNFEPFSPTNPIAILRNVLPKNTSYAMLELVAHNTPGNDTDYLAGSSGESGKFKRMEWSDTMNSKAIVMSDRLVEVVGNRWTDPEAYVSVWSSNPGDAQWGVLWNDNHVEYSQEVFFETQYGDVKNSADNLFDREPNSPNIQTGETTGGVNAGTAMMISNQMHNLLKPPTQ